MEEAALAVTQFLTRMIFPISLIAVCVGLVTLAAMILPPKKIRVSGRILFGGPLPRTPAPIVERIAVGLCAPLPILGLVVVVRMVWERTPGEPLFWWPSVLLVVLTLVLGLPAILWKTRLRIAAEGLATIALAAVSVLAGFSIGYLFVPLTLLMIWTCVQHLQDAEIRRRSSEPRRVDSSP